LRFLNRNLDKMKTLKYFLIGIVACIACNDETKDATPKKPFERSAMLTNMANNLIVPAYDGVLTEAVLLQQKITEFTNNPSQTLLLETQAAWKKTALAWQRCNSFNFGPAAEMGIQKTLAEEAATFPVSKTKIENFITANDTSFANFDRDSRGLYALDYLLFDENTSNELIVSKYNQSAARKHYTQACIHQFVNRVQKVRVEWNAYLPTFIAATGTDIGSSTSYLYNEFLKSFEGLKNFKFGIPLGRRPGQQNPLPQNVEAYYSGFSTELAMEHWKSVRYIWEGRGWNETDGIGFKEYLESVEGGTDLIAATQRQVDATQAAFTALPTGKLSDIIQQQFDKPDAVHTELQKLTRFYKSDLSSLIGIAVTYSSGDGD
jgi:uncharacterized protein